MHTNAIYLIIFILNVKKIGAKALCFLLQLSKTKKINFVLAFLIIINIIHARDEIGTLDWWTMRHIVKADVCHDGIDKLTHPDGIDTPVLVVALFSE